MILELAQVGPRMAPKVGRLGLGPIEILIIQIILISLALVVMWWILHGRDKDTFNKDDTPLDILNKRYAAGEVSNEDYERIKKDII